MWATEDKQDSDWEDDDSMDSAKEVVDVDKVRQNNVVAPFGPFTCALPSFASHDLFLVSFLNCCGCRAGGLKIVPEYFIPGMVLHGTISWSLGTARRPW